MYASLITSTAVLQEITSLYIEKNISIYQSIESYIVQFYLVAIFDKHCW